MNGSKPKHRNARQQELETRPGWAWLGAPLMVLEFAAALVLSWVVLAGLIVGDCGSGYNCAILYLILVLPGSVLAGIGVLILYNVLIRDMRTRIKIDVVVALSALVWLLAGQRAAERQARYEQQQSQLMQAMDRASADSDGRYGRDRFLAARRETGSHGPPGQVPGILAVQDDGITAQVELLDTLRPQLPLALARVRPDAARPGGWRGCPMSADVAQTNYGAYLLRPAQSLRFSPAQRCADAFRDAPLEFRVGSWKAGSESAGWWSDSALAVPEGWEPPAGAAEVPATVPRSAPPASDEPLLASPDARQRRERP